MEKQFVFFDLDRTLWDFEANSKAALTEIYYELNLSDLGVYSFESFLEKYRKINDYYWDLFRQNKVSKNMLRSVRFQETLALFKIQDSFLAKRIGDLYIEKSPRNTHLIPFTFEVLEYLKEKYELHIITNGFQEVQSIKLKTAKLASYFRTVTTSEMAEAKKPNPLIFNYALQQAKALPENSIMIGDDLEIDVIGAQQSGLTGVYFNPNKDQHCLSPNHEISCLSELRDIL